MSTKKRTEFEGKPKIIAQAGAITMNFGKEMVRIKNTCPEPRWDIFPNK